MNLLLKIFSGLVLVVVIAFGVSVYYIDGIIKEAVVRVVPELTGTPVALDSVNLSLLGGSAALSGLAIGNPQGFEEENAFSLGSVAVDLDTSSLTQDVIHIYSVLIEAPRIAYESSDAGNNLQTLLDNMTENMGGSEQSESASETTKKLIIDKFVLTDGSINVRHSLLSNPMEIALPNLELTDIGRESNGATAQQAASQIIKQTSTAAMSAVGSSALLDQAKQKFEQQLDETKEEVKAQLEKKIKELGVNEEKINEIKSLLKGFRN